MAWQKKTMLTVAAVLVIAGSAYWFWPETTETPAAAGQRPNSPWAMPVPVRVVDAEKRRAAQSHVAVSDVEPVRQQP